MENQHAAVVKKIIVELHKLAENTQDARAHFNHTTLYHKKSGQFYAAMKKGGTLEDCMEVFDDIPKPTNTAEQSAMTEQLKQHRDWYIRENIKNTNF